MVTQLRADGGEGFDLDAALEHIASMLGVESAAALMESVGENGRDFIDRIRDEMSPAPSRRNSAVLWAHEPSAQDRTSRREGLDGLDSWPPPSVPRPHADGADSLVDETREIVLQNETEIRRTAQLARADTAAWHSLSFTGTRDDEISHVMNHIIPAWGDVGEHVTVPIRLILEGRRDESAALIDGLPAGPA